MDLTTESSALKKYPRVPSVERQPHPYIIQLHRYPLILLFTLIFNKFKDAIYIGVKVYYIKPSSPSVRNEG